MVGARLRRLRGTFDSRCDFGALDGFLGLIPHDNLKECAFPRKPGFRVEQLEM